MSDALPTRRQMAVGLVLLAAAGTFAVTFELTGSYDWMWYADIVLAVGAALVHLPIREAPVRLAAATA